MSNDNIDEILPRPTGKITLNEANKAMANKRAFSGGRKKHRGGANTNSTTDLAAQSTEVVSVDPHPGASEKNIDSTTTLLNVTAQLNSDAAGAAAAKKESDTEQTGGKKKHKKTRRRKTTRRKTKRKKTKRKKTKRRRMSGKRKR